MGSTAEIDTERLVREAKKSKHKEAYQRLWERDGMRIGAGAQFTAQGKIVFILEAVIPFCSGSQMDLEQMEGKLGALKCLEEAGFFLTCQDDMSFSCELVTRRDTLEGAYERTASILAKL